ncbi:MAG: energy transducer TonB [Saprospiraceae bacterium]|nr:energy transducer TonB [Saprospiraceae bacterium]
MMNGLTMSFQSITRGIIWCAFVLSVVSFVGCEEDDDATSVTNEGMCLVEINGQFEDVALDEQPSYLNGGEHGFINAVYSEVRYPAEARENGIEGTCIANYEITATGTVENIVTIQNPGGGIGASVIDLLSTITTGVSFSPGVLDGNPVRVKKDLIITYKLEG